MECLPACVRASYMPTTASHAPALNTESLSAMSEVAAWGEALVWVKA